MGTWRGYGGGVVNAAVASIVTAKPVKRIDNHFKSNN